MICKIRLRTLLVIISLTVLSISSYGSMNYVYAADTTAPEIDLPTLCVDKTEVTVGDTVTIKVKAIDDVGVRNVTLRYRTPITEKKVFVDFVYNEAEDLYVGTYKVTEDSEAGVYKVDYLSAYDNALNHISYSDFASSTYIQTDLSAAWFNVYGTSTDVTPPVLDTFSITVDKKEATVGDVATISFRMTDDTGVDRLYVYMTNPETGKKESVGYTYNEQTGLYEVKKTIANNTASGVWKIDNIVAYDKKNNYITYSSDKLVSWYTYVDFSAADFNVYGTDSKGPVVDYSSISADVEGETTILSVKASDESGVDYIQAAYMNYELSYWGYATLRYDEEKDAYIGTCYLDGPGLWQLDGLTAYDIYGNATSCSDRSLLSAGDVNIHQHEWGEVTVVTPKTCTEDGMGTATCSVCGRTTTVLIPKGHQWGEFETVLEPTCTETGRSARKCTVCGEIDRSIQNIIPANGHTIKIIPEVPATCTEPGLTQGEACSVCGEILETQTIIPALDHAWGEWTVTKETTCLEAGEEQRVCIHDSTHVEKRTIKASGHKSEIIPAVAATCTKTGLTEGKKCSVCGEILEAQAEIPALDHVWGEWAVTKEATCAEAGEEQRACSRDTSHVEKRVIDTLEHKEEIIPAVAATCTETGLTEGKKCSVCGEILEAQGGIPALDHDWGKWTVTKEATCVESGEEQRVCSRDASHVEKRATDELGHDWGEWVTIKEATCTEVGEEQRVCRRNAAHIEKRAIDATGHKEEIIPAVAATCTEAGLIGGKKCSICGEIIKAQEKMPALGHDYREVADSAVAPTCVKDGKAVDQKCSRCDAVIEGVSIPATGNHTFGEWETVKEPTVDAEGTKERVCSVCGTKETETIDKLTPTEPTEEEKAIAAAREELNNKVTEAEKIEQGNYTDESYKALQDAIAEAEVLADDPNATAEQLNVATSKIEEAKKALKEKGPTEEEKAIAEAKEELNKAFAETKAIEQGNFSEESYKALQDAIAEAETLAAEPNVTAEQLKAAASTIEEAKNRLKVDPAKEYGEDGTPIGKGASVEAADATITNLPNDNDPAGNSFAPLMLKSTKQTKTSITLRWKKVSGAASYVIYGNKCGSTNNLQKLYATSGKTYTVKKIEKTLKKSTYHKFMVVALDSSNHVVSTSKVIHVATKGKGNYTKVTSKAKKNKVSVKKGKTFKLSGKASGKSVKKHVGIRYETSNPEIATVTKSGSIKGIKKGKCKVYVFAQNGLYITISVTVK